MFNVQEVMIREGFLFVLNFWFVATRACVGRLWEGADFSELRVRFSLTVFIWVISSQRIELTA